MKNDFDQEDFLPLTTIKNYFSTRARKLKTGKATLGKIIPDDAPDAVEGVELLMILQVKLRKKTY